MLGEMWRPRARFYRPVAGNCTCIDFEDAHAIYVHADSCPATPVQARQIFLKCGGRKDSWIVTTDGASQ